MLADTITTRLIATLMAVRARLRDERGQTAAEYLGIVVVVAVIIGILAETDIGDAILDGIMDAIDDITSNL